MAIYKPSNFYPNMDEIDMLEDNTFECQINTDGSKVKAYKIDILSEDGILLYENIGDFDDPISNNEFAPMEIKPFGITLENITNEEISLKHFCTIQEKSQTNNIIIYKENLKVKDVICNYHDYRYFINEDNNEIEFQLPTYTKEVKSVTDKNGEDVTKIEYKYDQHKVCFSYNFVDNTYVTSDEEDFGVQSIDAKIETEIIKNKIKIPNRFISLVPTMDISNRINYNPYCIYNIITKEELNCFCIKEKDSDENYYDIINVEYDLDNDDELIIILKQDIEISNTKQYFICLKNNFDYKWNVRFYEEKIGNNIQDYENKTFVTSGYLTGTQNGVILYNKNDINFFNLSQEEIKLHKSELINNYVKYNNYIELKASIYNSDCFKEHTKKGCVFSGMCYTNGEKIILKSDKKYGDFTKYDLENMYIALKIKKYMRDGSEQNLIKNTNTKIYPYFNLYDNGDHYIFYEKIDTIYQENDIWYININNKELLKSFTTNELYIHPSFYPNTNFYSAAYDTTAAVAKIMMGYFDSSYQITNSLSLYEFENLIKIGNSDNTNDANIWLYWNKYSTSRDSVFIKNNSLEMNCGEDTYPVGGYYGDCISMDMLSLKTIKKEEEDLYSELQDYIKSINNIKFNLSLENVPSNSTNSKVIIEFLGGKLCFLCNDNTYKWKVYYCRVDNESYFTTLAHQYNDVDNPITYLNEDDKITDVYTYCDFETNINIIDGNITYNCYEEESKVYCDIIIIINNNLIELNKINISDYIDFGFHKKALCDKIDNDPKYTKDSQKDTYKKNITDVIETHKGLFNIRHVKYYRSKSSYRHSISNIIIKDFYINFIEETGGDNKNIDFDFLLSERKKIYDVSNNLGYKKDINQILLEKDFINYLKDKENYLLYQCDRKHTNNSLYVTPNGEIQVGRYIRFPTIDGLIYDQYIIECKYKENSNSIEEIETYTNRLSIKKVKDYNTPNGTYPSVSVTSTSYNFPSESIDSNILINNHPTGYYVKSKNFNADKTSILSQDLFEKNQNFILYKIIGYDRDTGEIRLENDLYRTLSDTDLYEIWERREESGETTEEYFTRKLPAADKYDTYLRVGGEIIATIPCKNSNSNELFIQPNINLKSDEYYSPQIVFKNGDVVNIKFKYNTDEIYDYNLRDITINKLDNSQWIVETSDYNHPIKCGSEYTIYSGFVDSVPENYFYARKSAHVDLYFTDEQTYNENKYFENPWENYQLINADISFDYNIIRMMECVFIAQYTGDVSIKKYRYKIFDHNNELIKDSGNLYSNDLSFKVSGLKNSLVYKIELEIEDQYGYFYTYEDNFRVIYTIQSNNYGVDFNIIPTIEGNGLSIYINAEKKLSNWSSDVSKLIYNNIDNIDVYRSRINDVENYEYVSTMQISTDNVVQWKENEYVIGINDYNIVNDTWYKYLFILKSEQNEKTITLQNNVEQNVIDMKYTIFEKEIKTCFKSWSISDIELDTENNYVVGEIWELKYNLESNDITYNTSVTKWDTLGKYSQVSIGERGYNSSSVTCLLGDVSQYNILNSEKQMMSKDGYNEYTKNIYSNNADKLHAWKDFCNNGSLKLLQDYKGNKWIVQILENPTSNINVNTMDQISVISFNWAEVMDSENISLISNIKPYKTEAAIEQDNYDKLKNKWETIETIDGKIHVDKYVGSNEVVLDYVPNYTTYVLTTKCYKDSAGDWIIENPFTKGNTAKNITSFTIPEGVTLEVRCQQSAEDGNYVENNSSWDALFYDCSSLQTIDLDYSIDYNIIPETVKSLRYTFYGCDSLQTEIIINNNTDTEEGIFIDNMFSPNEISQQLMSSSVVMRETNEQTNRRININIVFEDTSNKGMVWWSKLGYTFKDQSLYDFIQLNAVDNNYKADKYNLSNKYMINNGILILSDEIENIILPEYLIGNQKEYIYSYSIILEGGNLNKVYFPSNLRVRINDNNIPINMFKTYTYSNLYINPNNSNYTLNNEILEANYDNKKYLITANQNNNLTEFNNYNAYDDSSIYTGICDYAFYNCNSLKNILLDGCEYIGKNAFDGALCEAYMNEGNGKLNLEPQYSSITLKIPNSVKTIKEGAFINNFDDNNDNIIKIVCINNDTDKINIDQNVFDNNIQMVYNCIDAGYWGRSDITDVLWKYNSDQSFELLDNDVKDNSIKRMKSLTTTNYPWQRYISQIKKISFVNIENVASYAFENSVSLESVNLSNNLECIENSAFYECTSLQSITIPETVNKIEDYAFYSCNLLTSINISNNVKEIGEEAFACTSLQSINIPSNITTIGKGVFYNCNQLIEVHISSGINVISSEMFECCTLLTSIIIPDSVTSIEQKAFNSCTSLTSIIIPDSVISIGNEAFSDCTSLTTIYYEGSQESWNAIRNILNISLNYSQTTIYYDTTIGKCGENASYILNSNTGELIINGTGEMYDYGNFEETPWYDLRDSIKNISLSSITSIGNYAFYDCKSLEYIVIPTNITSIGNYAFYDCDNLLNVYYQNTKDDWNNIAEDNSFNENTTINCNVEFEQCGPDAYSLLNNKGDLLILGKGEVTSIPWNDKKDNIQSVIIEDNITKIRYSAFLQCTSLETVILSKNITQIDDSTFSGCTALNTINIPEKITRIGEAAFYGCESLTEIEIPNEVTSIGESAFRGCTSLTSIIIPNSVTTIANYVFYNCYNLQYVYLPKNDSFTTINDIFNNSNNNSNNRTTFIIPNNINTINQDFSGMIVYYEGSSSTWSRVYKKGTQSIDIHYNCDITTINNISFVCYYNNSATKNSIIFYGKGSLGTQHFTNLVDFDYTKQEKIKYIKLEKGITEIQNQVFQYCTSLISIEIPDSVINIGSSAFNGCTSLPLIEIPDSVTSIGEYAFEGCTSLTSIIIPNSVTNIGEGAFSNCENLLNVYYQGDETSWNKIVDNKNVFISNPTIHYNSIIE